MNDNFFMRTDEEERLADDLAETDENDNVPEPYELPAGEEIAISFVEIATKLIAIQKEKKSDKIFEEATLELTEMLRGEDKSLFALLRVLLPIFKKISKDEQAKTQVAKLLTLCV